jgi:hypothetical protein
VAAQWAASQEGLSSMRVSKYLRLHDDVLVYAFSAIANQIGDMAIWRKQLPIVSLKHL